MPLIDDRGRVFGRLNIIDAALVAFVLVLVPLGYTASRLFRVPRPQIERVEPAAQPVGPARRVRLYGRDFRPYLRAFVSPTGQPFSLVSRVPTNTEGNVLLETPSIVEVELPADLAEGSYDLYLFDETQEVASRPGAFVLSATPVPEQIVQAKIRFRVSAEIVRLIKAGDIDLSGQEPATPTEAAASSAMLKAVRVLSRAAPAFEMQPMPNGGYLGWTRSEAEEKVVDADVTIPVRQARRGFWEYGTHKVRVGESFTFETPQYVIQGFIGEITPFLPSGSASADRVGK